MKRALRFLVRLYPSSWRQRYGAEFDALLDDLVPSVGDAFDILWGGLKMQATRWGNARVVLACSLAGTVAALLISLAMPVHYISQTMVTVAPANESSLRVLDHLGRDVFSEESLGKLIQLHNLYPRERAHLPLAEVIEKMRSGISLHPVAPSWPSSGDTLTFAIAFDYPDREVVQQINSELVSAFLEGNLDLGLRGNSHSNLEVLDRPSKPVGPNRMGLLAGGLFAGLLAGLAAVFLNSRRGTTICPTCGQRTRSELTALT